MENMYEVRRWGNSAGILLPREWLGKQMKVEVVRTKEDIKKELLEILAPFLEDMLGIYLVGSYARDEETSHSDIDVLCISTAHARNIIQGPYHIEIHPIASVQRKLKKDIISLYPRLYEAKPILNAALLEELRKKKMTAASLMPYLEACKRIIKINEEFLSLDRDEAKTETSAQGIIYSMMLRLRGLYMIKMIKQSISYTNESFISWLVEKTGLPRPQVENLYEAYRKERDGKKVGGTIPLAYAERLLMLLKSEVSTHDKKKKEIRKRARHH